MHKKIRIALATLFFVGITLLLLDVSGSLHAWLGWMAKIQFLPAVLALNLAVIVGLLLLTLLFGRVYCSVICPLGIWQDIVSNLSGRRKGKKARFSASPERKWLRYGVWVLFVAALLAGVQVFVALLAPYSAWGRIVQNLFQPLYIWGNNLLAWVAGRVGSYAFYGHPGGGDGPGMETRPDLVQYPLPGGHDAGILLAVRPLPPGPGPGCMRPVPPL